MGYYGRGDYYRGDYYRGDFWSTVGHIGSGIIDVATGNIGGAISQGAQALGLGGGGGGARSSPPPPPGTAIANIGKKALTGAVLFGPVGAAAGAAVGALQSANGVPRGYHISKRTGRLVRNRHMNPLNVKALRRADRRAQSFLKISRRVVRHYQAKAPKGKGYVHFKRKTK